MNDAGQSRLLAAGRELAKRYWIPLAIGLLGLLLLSVPSERTPAAAQAEPQSTQREPDGDQGLEARLASLLSGMEGAGNVEVMLTYKSSDKRIYQTDTTQSSAEERERKTVDSRTQTVLASSGGTQQPLVQQTVYPVCQGAVILCQGADQPRVRLAIVQAVSSLTGLGSDKISVVKMKEK